MRFNKFLCLIIVMFAASVEAQDLKILVNKKGKVGFADQNGNEVIKCQYESAMPFSDGVAIVTKSGKSGIIDVTGKVLLPLKYTQILNWNEHMFLVKNGKKMGLVDHNGKVVLPVTYSHISKPNCYGKSLIALGGKATSNEKKTYMANAKYGVINEQGKVLVTPKYKGLYEFSFNGMGINPYHEGKRLGYSYHNTVDTLITDCSYLGFSKNGASIYYAGIMDGSGKELLKQGLYYFVMQPQNNMVRYYVVKKKKTQCGYHNLSTGRGFQVAEFDKPIGELTFWSHGDFIGDIAPVNGSSWSFIDKNGAQVRKGYSSLKHSLATGLWAAKTNNGQWEVFDEMSNNVSVLSNYENIEFPSSKDDKEVFSVVKNGKSGCVSRTGDVVVPFEYETVLANSYDFIAVKKGGKWGAVSPENKVIVPVDYENLLLPSEKNTKHIWVKKPDSLYYHLNLEKQSLSAVGYKSANNFKNGIALVVPIDMKIRDTQVNRAQVYAPNAPKDTLDAVNIYEKKDVFGYLLNVDDELLMDMPVSTMYKEAVISELSKRNNRILSESEKKNILLEVTKQNRTYDLKSTLSEDEWNY